MRRNLTANQQKVLEYLIDYPHLITIQTNREAAEAAGFKSHQSFGVNVAALVMKGYLRVDPSYLRSLKRKDP